MEETLFNADIKKAGAKGMDFVIPEYISDKLPKEEAELSNVVTATIYNFIFGKKNMAICGAAGTGKTTLIKELINSLWQYKTFICAPSNKAVSQLPKKKDMFADNEYKRKNNKINIGTLQKGLGLTININDDGEEVFELTKQGDLFFEKYEYVVVDEASMVSHDLYYALLETKATLLFIGDSNQLSAPNAKEFNVFDMFKDRTLYLTHKKRFQNEELKKLTYRIEEAISKEEEFNRFLFETSITYRSAFVSKEFASSEDLDNALFIDYTNKGGQFHWLGKKKHYYIEGELYYCKETRSKFNKIDTYKMIKVENASINILGKDVKYKKCIVENTNTQQRFETCLYNPQEEAVFKDLKKQVNKIVKARKSGNFQFSLFEAETEIEKTIAEISEEMKLTKEDVKIIRKLGMLIPASVYTVHASQGSTFDTVLINLRSFDLVKTQDKRKANLEKLKLFYVAVTRAKHKVFYSV